MTERRRLRLEGVVQGVGMRPFLYNLARRLQLGGSVANDGGGVWVEVEGTGRQLDDFARLLVKESPPAARLDSVSCQSLPPNGQREFQLAESSSDHSGALVAPDLSMCENCLGELHDPKDRRHRYPFLNCTQCGPRFTIIVTTPYDRPRTTMREFVMCAACAREYCDPADRRFHAQPTACPKCGPRLEWWQPRAGTGQPEVDPLTRAVELLLQGGILGVKGLGGFHLACDLCSSQAVARIRQVKHRPHQPLAVMAKDLVSLERVADLCEADRKMLLSRERPIVLVKARVSSDLPWLGAMLPYTPLHELLLRSGPKLLVMTSANPSGVPIEYTSPECVLPLADAVLSHDRPIHMPCDDSLAFAFRGAPVILRRSRGYAPLPIELPLALPPLLAIGAELKNVFGLSRGRQAFLSQHLGDLQNLETLRAFERALEHFCQLCGVQPEAVVVDLHPGYLGRRWAERKDWPRLEVQHHHAHLASLMAEHGLSPQTELLGFCFDGTGYGTDQTLWGGEVLRASYAGFERLAHLSPMLLVGGEGALRHPCRLALTYLWSAGLDPSGLACESAVTAVECGLLERRWQLGQGVLTTSVGRLFDVVASLCGICQQVTFEGQAAVWLEARVDEAAHGRYELSKNWDVAGLLAQVLADLRAGVSCQIISTRFHRGLARAVRDTAVALGADRAGLTGGVFQNRYLLKTTVQELESAGVQALWHRQVPSNDGGLALGQLAVAGAMRRG